MFEGRAKQRPRELKVLSMYLLPNFRKMYLFVVTKIDKIPKDRPVFVHCKSGLRARIGASICEQHGIHASILPFKFEDIVAGGFKTEKN